MKKTKNLMKKFHQCLYIDNLKAEKEGRDKRKNI